MSDLVKWGMIVAIIITIVGILTATGVFDIINDVLGQNSVYQEISGFLVDVSSYLSNGRMLFNYFCNPLIATAFLSWIFVIKPLAGLSVYIISLVKGFVLGK